LGVAVERVFQPGKRGVSAFMPVETAIGASPSTPATRMDISPGAAKQAKKAFPPLETKRGTTDCRSIV
jgi:hypothetical protein